MDDSRTYVNPTVAKQYWAKHAYEVLVETAGRYNAVISYADFAEQVQERSGLWSKTAPRSWVGPLLADLAKVSHLREEPALSALVVKDDGHVGSGYDEVLRLAGARAALDDADARELHAATARLECYRHWGADVPDGAVPTLVGRAARPRTASAGSTGSGERATRAPRATRPASAPAATPRRVTEERRGAVCPRCFMEMPLSGVCANCD